MRIFATFLIVLGLTGLGVVLAIYLLEGTLPDTSVAGLASLLGSPLALPTGSEPFDEALRVLAGIWVPAWLIVLGILILPFLRGTGRGAFALELDERKAGRTLRDRGPGGAPGRTPPGRTPPGRVPPRTPPGRPTPTRRV